MLKADNVSFRVQDKVLLSEASVECRPGEFTVLMGPNGAGKTTLLRLLAGLYQPSAGRVLYHDKPLSTFSAAELAKSRAVLSQEIQLAFPLSVADVVLMGRYPHFQRSPSAQDQDIARLTLAQLGMSDFADRDYSTLSGGEAQKVQMARVLAQIWEAPAHGTRVLLLDEPVSSLDLRYQHQLLQIARDFSRQQTIVVAVLHDINLALAYADKLVFIRQGRVHRTLPHPGELDEQTLEEVFGLSMRIIINPFTHKPLVVYADSSELPPGV
ncbi:heme ABC transporter ATP-binding protein [Hymenobacter chitinivorans]|uniref:Iron complex transport system ATP-binding protein n=1 Tax=Hymenobacter chitinivorans DSM 11115 TaxID=1121954 RepID=A0A2M9BNV9_9BACT|nr:heme ABC transporter ATP-binding protein [Hymenobacter chitinivorans]PJJ59618.1 iron complex transport system ATP-binding protein [Hymenobacter chitinivorans DSM 11115]